VSEVDLGITSELSLKLENNLKLRDLKLSNKMALFTSATANKCSNVSMFLMHAKEKVLNIYPKI
jgi:hypothetical protein